MRQKTRRQIEERFMRAGKMRKEGKSWEEIGEALNVRPQTARTYGQQYESKTGERLHEWNSRMPEVVNPGMAAEIIDKAMTEQGIDPEAFMELATKAGLRPELAGGMLRRLKATYGKVLTEHKVLRGKALAEALLGKVGAAIDYVDAYTLSQMSGRDLATLVGIFVDKSLLLEGKPTQIIDVNVSYKLEQLMPVFADEARRRGITLEGTATPVQDEPDDSRGRGK